MISMLASVVVASVLGQAANGSLDAATRYAIIVSANRSLDSEVEPLTYADDDAVRYAEVFTLLGTQVWLLAELDAETAALARRPGVQPPSRAALLQALTVANARMAADRRRGSKPELYFVYSGHGGVDEDGEGYLNLADARLRRTDILDMVLRPSQADVNHVIIDACQSYFMVHARGDDDWVDDRVDVDLASVSDSDAEAERLLWSQSGFWLSTSSNRRTHEWEGFHGGVFSHELRSGMLGGADVDGDGVVRYIELEAYMAAANATVTDAEAKLSPYVRAPKGDGNLVFVVLPQAARRISLAGSLAGRFHLVDERGIRWADFHKAAGDDVAILLPRGLLRLRSGQGEQSLNGQDSVVLRTLDLVPTMLASRGSLDESFRRQLYGLAYGKRFYEGFIAARR